MPDFGYVVVIGLVGAAVFMGFFAMFFVAIARKASMALESLDELRDAVIWQGERLVEVASAVEAFPSTFVTAYERSKNWGSFKLEHRDLEGMR